MKNQTYTKGYSLVEVLVSIAILLLVMVGPMTIATQGIKSATFALEQNTAYFIAQEGIELIFKLRNNYALQDVAGTNPNIWNWVYTALNGGGSGPCSLFAPDDTCNFGIDFDDATVANNITASTCDPGFESNCRLYVTGGNVYSHDSSGTPTPFTRIITVKYISAYTVEVVSTVTWNSHVFGGAEQTVVVKTHLFNILADSNSSP